MSTPKYLKEYRAFIGMAPAFSNLLEMEQEYYIGADRSAVILQASNLEFILESLIQAKMRAPLNSDVKGRIFDGNGPLSNFSHKILIAYSLELIGPIYRHDLDLIRELRNGFAHVRAPIKLETPELAEVCKHLRVPDLSATWLPHAYSEKFDIKVVTDDSHPRTRFTRACHTMSLCMLELGQFLLGLPEGVARILP